MRCDSATCECQWCQAQRRKRARRQERGNFAVWMEALQTRAGAAQVRAILDGDKLSVDDLAKRWGYKLGIPAAAVQRGIEALLERFPEGG